MSIEVKKIKEDFSKNCRFILEKKSYKNNDIE